MTGSCEAPRPRVDASYGESILRFDADGVADKYPSAFGSSWRERREVACLRSFLSTLPPGSRVLDLPCGTGRLTPLLAERRLEIVGVDSSPKMARLATENWERWRAADAALPDATFEVGSASDTRFSDASFDAVVCNRLFHHFRESTTRVAVLKEFRRICHGRIFLSFFNAFAVDAVKFRLRHFLRGTTPTDRLPISMTRMRRDVEAAGLRVLSTSAVAWGLSPMWYLELCDAGRGHFAPSRTRSLRTEPVGDHFAPSR